MSALLLRPAKARQLLVLAHGAGAGMSHPFMEKLAGELAGVGVATLRYQFPYMEARRRAPDAPALLTATVVSAVRAAANAAPGLPLLAGGKSMGGRMTSQAAAQRPLDGVQGLVFFGFPLHPPNRRERNERTTSRGLQCRCCSYRERGIRSPISSCCGPCVRSWARGRRCTLLKRRIIRFTC